MSIQEIINGVFILALWEFVFRPMLYRRGKK